MFFHRMIHRRLASLLQPWLQEALELELELGLINSSLTAKNLSFDAAALNRLLAESPRFSFKEVSVEHLSIHFSSWSVPAFKIEVRGVRVSLSAGELKDERASRGVRKSSEAINEEKKKALAGIDPEGSALHDVLEKILVGTHSRNGFTTSLWNLVLKRCHLQMFDTNMQVQFPLLNDALVCLLELKELNAESQCFEHGCFFRGLVGAVFKTLKVVSFNVDFRGFELGYSMKDRLNPVCSSTNLFTCIQLNDLHVADLRICVPELNLLFSPLDLNILLTVVKLLSRESEHVRNGRQLWRLAANRLGSVISSPRLSLHNLVEFVCLWLRYLNAYENLLSLLRYSGHELLKKSASKMSQDKMFPSSVKHNWKVISIIEKELPAEVIAQARRIARYRASLSIQHGDDSYKESTINNKLKAFSNILLLLDFIWHFICKIFLSIVYCFFLIISIFQEPEPVGCLGILSEDYCPQYLFLLNFGKILITFYPANKVQNVREPESHIGVSYSETHSFCLSIDALFLESIDEILGQSLSISCGQFEVKSSSAVGTKIMESSANNNGSSVRGQQRRTGNLKTVLWGAPALMFLTSQTGNIGATCQTEDSCNPLLKKLLGETWLNWKRVSTKYDDSEIVCSENPWLLCEIKTCIKFPGMESPDSGFWKCSLAVGKINVALGYSSLLLMAILLEQVRYALNWTKDSGRTSVLSHSSSTIEHHLESIREGKYEFFASRMKMTLLGMLPGRCIQFGVFITGPHIQMSLVNDGFNSENNDINQAVDQDDFHLVFDIHNIEALVWPTSKSDVALTKWQGSNDSDSECQRLPEPRIIEIPRSDNEKYASEELASVSSYLCFNGLDIHMGDLTEREHSQIFALRPIAVQLAFFRESVHSFSTTTIAFSSALCGVAGGSTVISYMDELYIFFQVVTGLYSAVSHAFNTFDLSGYTPSQDFMGQNTVFTEVENGQTTAEGTRLIYNSTLFSCNAVFKFKSLDIILQSSKKKDGALSSRKMTGHDLPDCGILISVDQTRLEISCEKEKLEVLFDLLGIQSVIFGHQDHVGEKIDRSVFRNLLRQSYNSLYEISLSSCTLALRSGEPQHSLNDSLADFTLGGETSLMVENSHFILEAETSSARSHRCDQKLAFASNLMAPSSSHWIIVNVTLGAIFVARSLVKNFLIGAHQFDVLTSKFSVEQFDQTISWRIQGGLLFLETRALMMFVRCFASYLLCIANLVSIIESPVKEIENAECDAQVALRSTWQTKWELPESSTLDVSQFSLVLAVEDESGGFQELVVEVDVHVKLESANMQKKFLFDLSRLSIFAQILQESVINENKIPHFSSAVSNESSHFAHEDPAMDFQLKDGNHISHQNYILNHLVAFISVKKPEKAASHLNQVWIGNGSVAGFNMTISLCEIQMISSIFSCFPAASSKEIISDMKQRTWFNDQETDHCVEDMIPNGAIVAIKDVNQHMYFSVEGEENKYNLGGVIHYSLVGEKALFRVKHHKPRIWKSSVLWFSLISLHAKNGCGEPLRLNYRPGSGAVDISSTNDNVWSLWRRISCGHESHEGDNTDWEPHSKLVKKAFYLVNKKNDCAVAFVDGIPEFVRKPGNPFKFKVFHDIALARDVAISDEHLHPSVHRDEAQTHEQGGSNCCVQIEIDDIAMTIFHELLDTKDRFPLLHGCISNTQLNVQILPHKTRIMSTSSALLRYFDAQKNLWKLLVHPAEICTFYHSSFQTCGSETVQRGCGVPVHYYCRTKGFNLSLTELSLDIILFVIGNLNLAGPFSVRKSLILANCCKVENQSGLILLCHFYNNKSVTITRKQSASVLFRHPVSSNQPPESTSAVTIQLSNLGSFATSSLHLSLSKTQVLAWRTRIMSLQDSRTYPGPFVVVDISRKSEDGLLVVVSPLIRIYNETEFSMELRFQRPQQNDDSCASVLLKKGDTIDDSMATFDAINLSGGLKKALMSLSVGNFLFSFRPEITDGLLGPNSSVSAEWSESSDELKGRKAVHLSGIFNKLGYKIRRALSVESVKCSFSTAWCTLMSENACVTRLHFLVQTIGRDVPIIQPDKSSDGSENINSAVTLQQQKEIFLLPTVRVSNLLHAEIHVLLSETDVYTDAGNDNIGKQATISCGSTVDFYANPSVMYFTVTLTAYRTSCKPVNSGDWVKKLLKKKSDVDCLDIDLDFGGGKYLASLRLFRGHRGILEVAIFTPYSLTNDTDFSLLIFSPNQKPLSRDEVMKIGSSIPPVLGLFLPPNSKRSWFSRSHKMRLKMLEDHVSEAMLDLDALPGVTEISLEREGESGVKYIRKFGVSVGPSLDKVVVPSQTVTMVPRHVVFNESEESITVSQCYLQNEMEGMIHINSKQRTALQLQSGISKGKEFSLFENIIKKHRNDIDTSSIYVQFRLNESESGWSGPVCIASLGCFFVKFRKQSNQVQELDNSATEFAVVHVVEEGSTLGVHFHHPPNVTLPYRIENHLCDSSLTFYQKDSSEREVIGSDCCSYYAWEDLTLPHKLVVLVSDMQLLREINLDKVRAWKPFLKQTQHRRLASLSVLDKKSKDKKTYLGQLNSMEIVNVGYEIYADGPTRVLRICELPKRHQEDRLLQSRAKIELRVSYFAVHLLESRKEDLDENEESSYTPIIAARLGNINLDSLFTNKQKYNQISIESLNVDPKWTGAPFAAVLRRHHLDLGDPNAYVFKIVFVLLSSSSSVRQVKYSSVVVQPIDLNLDEETLMRVASFWRTSLKDSRASSCQYYFDHFEIHPIKITATFLPGESYSSYNSAQETLRSLLHSVVKVPPIKNMVVELNGVLVTHALITMRELFIRCAQHYSWYAMRAIYIAKGSPFLPPAFASIFDDLASSSLDVFFDPSRGFINLPGFTLGTFKFISKCIDGKGFSGTKRYFGDLGKSLRVVGSNVLFAAVTEISDSVLKGAEASGFDGMVSGFHQGILKLAMEPSLLGTAVMGGGPDKRIKLDRSPGVDELYIEGYLQAMLDMTYRQEYLRVRVIDDQVFLKNLPPNSALIEEITDHVKAFLVSKALLKGDSSTSSRPLRHLPGENEWKIGPTVMTLCEHLLVSFAIRMLRKQSDKFMAHINWKKESVSTDEKAVVPASSAEREKAGKFIWTRGVGKFALSGILAYIDGRLCRCIPNPVARRIVSGFLLSFLDKSDG